MHGSMLLETSMRERNIDFSKKHKYNYPHFFQLLICSFGLSRFCWHSALKISIFTMFLVGPFHTLCLFCGHHFMLCSVHLSSVTSCPHDCNKLATKVQRRVRFNSVAQSFPTLCNPMNHSTPGLPVHHQLPEFTQTHAHPVGDVIQISHPLSSPSAPALNSSQHQGLFQWVSSLLTCLAFVNNFTGL